MRITFLSAEATGLIMPIMLHFVLFVKYYSKKKGKYSGRILSFYSEALPRAGDIRRPYEISSRPASWQTHPATARISQYHANDTKPLKSRDMKEQTFYITVAKAVPNPVLL